VENLVTGVDAAFWHGRRVFLTGHTGFKGAWLSLWLQQLGARVTGYALPPESGRPSLFEAASVAEGMRSVLDDVRDLDSLSRALRDADPEVVLHLAAQSLVRRSYAEPVSTYATNVMGTVNLLEACREAASIRAVVVVTSDKAYENREWPHAYRETDAMGGRDPYSSSKGCT
jgi:CDP-glucose 4,6-dehydratase